MLSNLSYYGGFRTRTFSDIFPSYNDFLLKYNETNTVQTTIAGLDDPENVFQALYAKYGNSHIAFSDENQFVFAVWTALKQGAVSYNLALRANKRLNEMSEEELRFGGKAIYNHSFNPSTAPSTSTMEELLTINDQNTTNYKKTVMEGYAAALGLVDKNYMSKLVDSLKDLFLKVLEPDYPLLYKTEIETEII